MAILINQLFAEQYNKAPVSVVFDPKWVVGDRLDGVVGKDLGLRSGKLGRSIFPDGRQIILIGTPIGNVAIFEEYAPTEEGLRTLSILKTIPRGLENMDTCWFLRRLESAADFSMYFGNEAVPNIGRRLANLRRSLEG